MTALAERNSWACEGVDDLMKYGSASGDEEPKLVRTLRGHRGAIESVAFSPTKRQLASGGADSCVMLWAFGGAHDVAGPRVFWRCLAATPWSVARQSREAMG